MPKGQADVMQFFLPKTHKTKKKGSESMSKFLYGASVQGIQSFIFQTNTLKEIVGASELVEKICTGLFAEQIGKTTAADLNNDDNAILNAAGNIKYIFEDESHCRRVFMEFPKKVLEAAPGITISQAVVKIEDNVKDAIQKLEKRLRAERNMPMQPMTSGLMGIQRSRETGLPERIHTDAGTRETKYCDEGTYRKLSAGRRNTLWEKATGRDFLKYADVTDNVSYFTGDNDWIAIIHADGNGLGQKVRQIGANSDADRDFHTFSSLLDKSTQEAARYAFGIVLKSFLNDSRKYIPFRPIVLGGDDLTVIIRGDLAIEFTLAYLKAFERFTRENFQELANRTEPYRKALGNGLTACAGIAFIKSSFPYYYGYQLAEELCSEAKKDSNRDKSCLMFHKVQDSFIGSYKEIEERELSTQESKSFKFGPYYLNEKPDRWTISSLLDTTEKLTGEEGNALKSDIRQWLSAMMSQNGTARAAQIRNRLKDINPDRQTIDLLTTASIRDNIEVYPAYDVLSLHSIYYQKTK